jgi:hypothetical protein
MTGPYKPGTSARPEWLGQYFLVCNQRYRVLKAFFDTDGDEHPVGEEWRFVGNTINNYDSEVTFVVRCANGDEWQFILGDEPDRQHEVLAHIAEYLTVI